VAPAAATATAVAEAEEDTAAAAEHVSLPELAREAAMRAERVAIQQALDRFRWNRRKAADYLGVSYKTLLNKMKECGISEQQ
jgi:DNA-binding NtrC family response regulator